MWLLLFASAADAASPLAQQLLRDGADERGTLRDCLPLGHVDDEDEEVLLLAAAPLLPTATASGTSPVLETPPALAGAELAQRVEALVRALRDHVPRMLARGSGRFVCVVVRPCPTGTTSALDEAYAGAMATLVHATAREIHNREGPMPPRVDLRVVELDQGRLPTPKRN